MKKDRYVAHLTEDENKMLDIMADIIVGYIMRTHEEQKIKNDKPQAESNQYSADSEPIVCRKKKSKKKALETQALSI